MSQYIYDSKTKNITPVAGLFNNPIGYPVMTGATNTEDGKGGLVPQPKIEDMNKALFGDGTYKDIENNNDSISNRWNNTKEYSVGDYCIHNNILWNCLTAHTNQTPIMDSTYWKQCNITEEMHKLNAGITFNSNEIGRLNENITSNTEDIEVLTGNISKNSSDIEVLTGNISKNSSDIEVLSGLVDSNNDYLRHVTTTNMFKPTMATTTLNGVTCTNNGDGTFTVNGTATTVTFFCIGTVSDNMLSMGKGDTQIKLLGCPKSSQPYYVLRWQHDDDHNKYKDTYLEGAVISFSNINYDTYYNRAWIRIEANSVCDNLVFKPMVTTNLEATYDDFVPYTGETGLINREVSTLVSQMKETVSDAWNKTVTYGINAYCIHKNALWKCLLQHTNQEPVNGSIYWEKCTVATELSKLNSDLVNTNDILTKLNTSRFRYCRATKHNMTDNGWYRIATLVSDDANGIDQPAVNGSSASITNIKIMTEYHADKSECCDVTFYMAFEQRRFIINNINPEDSKHTKRIIPKLRYVIEQRDDGTYNGYIDVYYVGRIGSSNPALFVVDSMHTNSWYSTRFNVITNPFLVDETGDFIIDALIELSS